MPRRSNTEILKSILRAAKNLNRESYSVSELARKADVTRKTARCWLRIFGVVGEVRVLPLQTKVAYYEGRPGRGRRRRRKRSRGDLNPGSSTLEEG